MASCKLQYLAKWHFFYYFYDTFLIFWAQKCWFIELNLSLGSDAVCVRVADGENPANDIKRKGHLEHKLSCFEFVTSTIQKNFLI